MNDDESFDAELARHFGREHQQVPDEPFVSTTVQRIRFEQRLAARIRSMLGAGALLAAILASPWLIAGASWLNAALQSSIAWTAGLPGAWVLGVLAIVVGLAARARSR